MEKKWKVFISSSSGYQGRLIAIKSEIKDFLLSHHIISLISEEPDFPMVTGYSLSQVCRTGINQCDMMILLIDSIYGTIPSGDNISITHSEYEYAKTEGKPVIILIDKHLFGIYRKKKNNEVIEDASLECAGLSSFDEDDNLFMFIDYLDSEKKYMTGEYLNPVDFSDIDNVLSVVANKINWQAWYFLEKNMQKQFEIVSNRMQDNLLCQHISDQKWKYIPTCYNYLGKKGEKLIHRLEDLWKRPARILLYGEPGSGKSTTVEYFFIKKVNEYNLLKSQGCVNMAVPLFFSFRNRGKGFKFSMRYFFENETAYPFIQDERMGITLPDFKVDLFADSLDECSYSLDADSAIDIINNLRTGYVHINNILLSSRKKLVNGIKNYNLNIFNYRIEILGWTERAVNDYVLRLSKNNLISAGTTRKFYKILPKIMYQKDNPSFSYWPPLYIMLVLEILESDPKAFEADETKYSIANLLKVFIHNRCLNELGRYGLANISNVVAMEKIIFGFSWMVKDYNQDMETYNFRETVFSQMPSDCPIDLDLAIKVIENFYLPLDGQAVPIHKLFEDYLLAEKTIDLLMDKSSVADFLKKQTSVSSITNRMITDLLKSYPLSSIQQIIDNIINVYNKSASHSARLILLYMVPRFSGVRRETREKIIEFLECEYHKYEESSENDFKYNFELVPILIWLSLSGRLKYEAYYYNRIFNNETFDKINRGCHMVYQKDILKRDFEFVDDGQMSWEKTAESFIEHYSSNDMRHRFIRRIDLAILRSFIISHKNVPKPLKDFFDDMDEKKLLELTFYSDFDDSGKWFSNYFTEQKGRPAFEKYKNDLLNELHALKQEINIFPIV